MIRQWFDWQDMLFDKLGRQMERLASNVAPAEYLTMKDRIPNNSDAWSATLKRIGPAAKLRAAQCLYFTARRIKEAAIRAKHPTWADAQVKHALNESFWNARD